jgi:steroid delta-isomerase-like uncharacterized protein
MSTELYTRWLTEIWGAGDYAVAEVLIDEDVVDHNPVPGQPAGRAGQVWAAQQIRTALPDCAFVLDVCFADEDLVTGRWTMTGTHTGPLEMMGLPPTGRPVTMSGQEIFRVRDGRLAEVWHAEDIGSFMRTLDLEPPPLMLRLAAKRSARAYRKQQRRS